MNATKPSPCSLLEELFERVVTLYACLLIILPLVLIALLAAFVLHDRSRDKPVQKPLSTMPSYPEPAGEPERFEPFLPD